MRRPALERLRDLIHSGGVERLYVHLPDRLARKFALQAVLLEEFLSPLQSVRFSGKLLTSGRAQCLSASLWSARGNTVAVNIVAPVLNAFRRHCGRHGLSPYCGQARATVLNAFRRHCGRHSIFANATASAAECSTPFGVTVVGTLLVKGMYDEKCMCSTPFGVTVVGTPPSLMGGNTGVGAQRLSASLWSAPLGYPVRSCGC